MNIADELRKYASDATTRKDYMAGLVFDLNCIANRIDAKHEEDLLSARNHGYELGCEDAYEAAYQDGENAILAVFDKRGNADVDERMAEHGWVKLPVDANGEVIHLGDVVMLPDWPLNHHEVINLVYAHDGWAIISRHGSIEASEHTVHVKPKKPTVEDMLQEFARRITGRECMTARPDIIAEYADKLQLKED